MIFEHPLPTRSAGLRFAVSALSKTVDVGRDHLIHRKRSPFPYEGKALTRGKVGKSSIAGVNSSLLTPHSPDEAVPGNNTLPLFPIIGYK